MVYYLVFITALVHTMTLYRRYRDGVLPDDENDRILMGIAFAVETSLPLLGWLRMSWIATSLLLLVVIALYQNRYRLPPTLRSRMKICSERCRGWEPIPSLLIAITGLFCWGWYW